MRILALDGGNTTGTALWTPDGLVLGKVVGRRMAYRLVAETPDLDAIAYEWFIIRQGLREAHADVVYINGAVEAEAERRGIPFYRYMPKESKRRVTDDMLKLIGWWPGFGLRTGGHAADAARVLYCVLEDYYPQEMPNG